MRPVGPALTILDISPTTTTAATTGTMMKGTNYYFHDEKMYDDNATARIFTVHVSSSLAITNIGHLSCFENKDIILPGRGARLGLHITTASMI